MNWEIIINANGYEYLPLSTVESDNEREEGVDDETSGKVKVAGNMMPSLYPLFFVGVASKSSKSPLGNLSWFVLPNLLKAVERFPFPV